MQRCLVKDRLHVKPIYCFCSESKRLLGRRDEREASSLEAGAGIEVIDHVCGGAAVESKRQGAKEAELGEAEARRVAPPPASETIIFAVRLTATRAMNQLESKPL